MKAAAAAAAAHRKPAAIVREDGGLISASAPKAAHQHAQAGLNNQQWMLHYKALNNSHAAHVLWQQCFHHTDFRPHTLHTKGEVGLFLKEPLTFSHSFLIKSTVSPGVGQSMPKRSTIFMLPKKKNKL